MEIKIDAENDYEAKPDKVILSNDVMDNDNFIDITVGKKPYTVNIDELHSAILAFKSLRTERLEREKLTEE